MEHTIEDFLYNEASKVIEKRILECISKEKVQDIVNEIFSKDKAKEWIIEYIEYSDEFRNRILEYAMEIIEPKMINMIKSL